MLTEGLPFEIEYTPIRPGSSILRAKSYVLPEQSHPEPEEGSFPHLTIDQIRMVLAPIAKRFAPTQGIPVKVVGFDDPGSISPTYSPPR